jgi:hypothetical protein
MDHDETPRMQPERYVLGELGEEQRVQYEAHFFDCRECADEVQAAAVFIRVAQGIFAGAVPDVTAPSLAVEVIAVPAGRRVLGLLLGRPCERRFACYRCEVRDGSGRSVASEVIPGPARGDQLHILLAVAGLPPGSYVISLGGLDSHSGAVAAPDLARYQFTLHPPEESHGKIEP